MENEKDKNIENENSDTTNDSKRRFSRMYTMQGFVYGRPESNSTQQQKLNVIKMRIPDGAYDSTTKQHNRTLWIRVLSFKDDVNEKMKKLENKDFIQATGRLDFSYIVVEGRQELQINLIASDLVVYEHKKNEAKQINQSENLQDNNVKNQDFYSQSINKPVETTRNTENVENIWNAENTKDAENVENVESNEDKDKLKLEM